MSPARIAEKMSPDNLMELMNEYLSAMTDVIERHGGYVDKYIGDSIVAVFGAPADDPDHAANAVRAAVTQILANVRAKRPDAKIAGVMIQPMITRWKARATRHPTASRPSGPRLSHNSNTRLCGPWAVRSCMFARAGSIRLRPKIGLW